MREEDNTPLAKRDGSKEMERLDDSKAVSEKRQLAGSLAPSKEKLFGKVLKTSFGRELKIRSIRKGMVERW